MASLGTQRCDFEPQLFKLFAYDEAKTLGLSCLVFKIEIITESVSHGYIRMLGMQVVLSSANLFFKRVISINI